MRIEKENEGKDTRIKTSEKGVILVDEVFLQLFFNKNWLFFIGLCVENLGQCGWKLKCEVEGKFYILLV